MYAKQLSLSHLVLEPYQMLTAKKTTLVTFLLQNEGNWDAHFKRASRITKSSVRATSHLSVRLTAMHVTVNEVPSHLCKILTLIIVKTYLQAGKRRYRIARSPVVTCYNSAKPPAISKSVRKLPKTHSFSAGRTSRNGLYSWDNANFSAWTRLFFSSSVLYLKMIMHNIFSIKRVGYYQWPLTLDA